MYTSAPLGVGHETARRRLYVSVIENLAYGSDTYAHDMRSIPLLADVLRHAHKLKYLELDLHPRSSRMVISTFRAAGILGTQLSLWQEVVAQEMAGASAVCSLRHLRCSDAHLAEQFCWQRALKTLDITAEMTADMLEVLFDGIRRSGARDTVKHLALRVSSFVRPVQVVLAVAAVFPHLRILSLTYTFDDELHEVSTCVLHRGLRVATHPCAPLDDSAAVDSLLKRLSASASRTALPVSDAQITAPASGV